MIRQYIKQKAARAFSGRYDLDVIKKEIKDEVTYILYDQTRRTPIVIPVINEIGVGGGGPKPRGRGPQQEQGQGQQRPAQADRSFMPKPSGKRFPEPQIPDTEVVAPKQDAGRDY